MGYPDAKQPQPTGEMVVQTNFRVPSEEARSWVLADLTRAIQSLRPSIMHQAEFRPTSVPTIVELEQHIAVTTFTRAEQVSQDFVKSVLESVDGRFRLTEMSTGMHPAGAT